jgi:tRNA modification GTPase
MDTIFALASAQGKAGVSIIRLSGPRALEIALVLGSPLPAPRQAAVRYLRDASGNLIDQAIVLTFEGPNSFTGEDTVEFHTHGSAAVVEALLRRLSEFEETRLADPGEFTRRALENDRLDLTQVEGLADLIEAETEAQRKQALQVLSGQLGEKIEGWRKALIRAAALLEATIDFADEEVPVDVSPEVSALLSTVISDLEEEISGSRAAERVRHGFEVAIVGLPNAGKSTLLNRLAGREAAIISEVPGTTRDVIEVRMDLGGLPVTFLDTAGLRETTNVVEIIGVDRAIERALAADLRVFLVDHAGQLMLQPESDDIILKPKADLQTGGGRGISGLTGEGVPELLDDIRARFEDAVSKAGLATHERHRVAMQQALSFLRSADAIIVQGPDQYDIASEELRSAIRALEVLVGRIDVEALLDEIFSSFCLGK